MGREDGRGAGDGTNRSRYLCIVLRTASSSSVMCSAMDVLFRYPVVHVYCHCACIRREIRVDI